VSLAGVLSSAIAEANDARKVDTNEHRA
jgi:hypothetical protein